MHAAKSVASDTRLKSRANSERVYRKCFVVVIVNFYTRRNLSRPCRTGLTVACGWGFSSRAVYECQNGGFSDSRVSRERCRRARSGGGLFSRSIQTQMTREKFKFCHDILHDITVIFIDSLLLFILFIINVYKQDVFEHVNCYEQSVSWGDISVSDIWRLSHFGHSPLETMSDVCLYTNPDIVLRLISTGEITRLREAC